jgi:hypothetical protein
MRVETAHEPVDRSASWVTSAARLARHGGSATVISLEGLRRALGERWPKLREAAAMRLEALLHQHLGPADCFVPLDELNRLVIMPQAVAADAELSCLRIVYDLSLDLLGSCRIDQLTVSPASAIGDNIIEVDSFAAGELADLVGKAGLAVASGAADEPALDQAPAAEAAIRVIYEPVWDATLQLIRAYRARTADGFRRQAPENSPQAIQALARAELTVLRQATADLLQHLTCGERFILTVPVSNLILSAPLARMQFLATCRSLQASLRPYLAFTVKDFAPGIPQSRVAEVDTILQAFCGAVQARVPHPAAVSLPDFRTTGIKALGVSLKGLSARSAELEILALTSETRRTSRIAFADHVDDGEKLQLCLDHGVRWLSGMAVAPVVTEPGPLVHLSRVTLMKSAAA